MKTRFLQLGVGILLLVVLLAPVVAQAAPEPQSPESEPNDTFFEANYLSLGHLVHGRIAPAGDIDMYRLGPLYEVTPAVFSMRLPESSPLVPVLTLYDDSGSVLAQQQCPRSGPCLSYQLPEWASIYASISDGQNAGGPAFEYSFVAVGEVETPTDPNEPNDFISEATPYTIGETMAGLMEPEGDIDTFSFHLEAQQEVQLDSDQLQTRLVNADGEVLDGSFYSQQIFMVPQSGTYYLQIISGPQAYEFTLAYIQRPIYASFSGAGTLDGVAFKPGDILVYTSLDDTWRMSFRAADYGLRGNLAAFDREGEYQTNLYLTYATAQNVPGVGPITPHDVLQYIPGNPDWGTDPEWHLVFDGSQVGLTTAAERLDALTVEGEYSGHVVHLSTTGRAQLALGGGQWHIANNDVITYRSWVNWLGNLRGLLSGPANGFGKANVVGLDANSDTIYLAFDRNLTLGGVPIGRGDIVACGRPSIWETTCESFIKIFDASDAGVGGFRIDGIDVGEYQTP